MRKFGLTLHPRKTRLIRFGRYAAEQRRARGEKKPETFDFLGFTHYCTKTRNGWFKAGRKSIKKRIQGQIQAIKEELSRRLHRPVQETGEWLKRVLQGHLNYYAVSGNGSSLNYFFGHVKWYWLRSLRRRSQRHRMPWERSKILLKRFFPPVRILHHQPVHLLTPEPKARSQCVRSARWDLCEGCRATGIPIATGTRKLQVIISETKNYFEIKGS